jgi:RNA polymerase sigma-54 factor
MVLLQPKLHLKVSQRQILTPGLVQMVSVLALNKLELKDMINAEMVENPVLEELEDAVPLIDDVGRKEEERERESTVEETPSSTPDKKDPFEEIDFGSFFKDYLDPGFRSPGDFEEIERPSFENFLSKPSTLTDHLTWQLGSISIRPPVREAAELVIGNLNEDGYLIASDEELLGTVPPASVESDAAKVESLVKEAAELGLEGALADVGSIEQPATPEPEASGVQPENANSAMAATAFAAAPAHDRQVESSPDMTRPAVKVNFSRADLQEAIETVRQMDPAGVACRNLRECLLYQLRYHQAQLGKNGNGSGQVLTDAIAIVDQHLRSLQNKQYKEIARAIVRPVEAVQVALEYIRTLDPRPGLRYNKVQARLIEPDVAFVKHGDEWLVIMNDDDVPTLRLNPAYRKLLTRDGNDRETRNYVKERFKSDFLMILLLVKSF